MKHYFIPVLAVVTLVINSCSGDKEQKNLRGDIIGFVKIFDQDAKPYSDHSGISIRLYNEDLTVDQEVMTDITGQYLFSDIPQGLYRMETNPEGLVARYSQWSVSHLGGEAATIVEMEGDWSGPFGYNYLAEKVTHQAVLDSFSATIDTCPEYMNILTYNVYGHIIPADTSGGPYNVLLFFGTDASVSTENYELIHPSYPSTFYPYIEDSLTFSMTISDQWPTPLYLPYCNPEKFAMLTHVVAYCDFPDRSIMGPVNRWEMYYSGCIGQPSNILVRPAVDTVAGCNE